MGRLICRVLVSVGTLLIVNADDGWRRVVEPVAGHEARARSSDTGARIPFNPEDRAALPPWLVPPNPKHLGFPPERPKVMSFFDEEPAEFLPWPLKGPHSRSSQQPQQQQPYRELPSFLQPPPAARQDPPSQQNQQPLIRQEQRQVPVYKPKPLLSPPPATTPPSVANLRTLPSTILANERHDDPFRPSQPAAEPKQREMQRATAAPASQSAPLEASRRKSVRPVYDSSEYDYVDEGPVAASHDTAPLNSRAGEQQPREDEAAFYDDDDYYDNQKRRQSAPKSPSRNKNREPSVAEAADYDHFDPEETIFRTQVGSPQQFRPQPQRPQQFDDAAEARDEDEPLVEEEPAATRPHKAQPSAGRKQQVPAQQSGRDRSPTEPSRFETERPSFKPEERPQPDADWPYRAPSSGSRKSKPKVPALPEPDEQFDDASFESGRTRVKSTPPTPPSTPSFFAEPTRSDVQKQRRPSQQRNNAEKVANRNKPTGFDPSFDQSEPEQQAPLAYDASSRYQQRNPHQGSGARRAKPTPTPAPYEPASFAVPSEEEPAEHPELQRRPVQRRPSARPAPPKPEALEPEPYDDIDDEPLIPFSVPTPRTKRPQTPPPQLQVPKDASLATKGLQTLKTLAALQSTDAKRQPVQQRPQEPHHVEEKVKPEARRPSGKRPAPSRYQPPQPDAFDSEPKSSGTRLPDSDPIPFGFFNAQEKEPSPSEDRLDSDELPLPATLKPSGKQTTTTPEPAPSSDESEERKPSTLFPPFNKRARPTASTAAPKTTTESVERSKPSPSDKESAPVLPRITSYKQRIEAMKERVRLQQQQQHQAQSKKDDDVVAEPVDVKPSTTSTTTTRKPTTRAKFPTRMPTKKAITEASSTTESAADFPIEKGLPTFDESRRRFKPKNSYSRKPEIKEEPAESDPSSDALEENLKKDVLPKLSDHPYRRKQQQKDRVQLEDMKPAEPPIRPPSKDPSKRRPNFSRTTSRPVVDDDDEEPTPASRPSIKKPIKTLVDSNRDVETSDDEPVIELIEVSSDDNQSDKQPKPLAESSEHDEVKPVQVAEHFEPTQEPFVEKPARSDEEDEPVEERVTSSGSGNVRERLPIFTMATNDPMLPIEELLNIRIRDDGKGM